MGAPRHPAKGATPTPARPVLAPPEQRILPLEPRLLLDANLEWDLAGTSALTSALSGLAQAFERHQVDVEALLDGVEASSDGALAKLDTIVDVAGAASADLDAVTEAVSRIRDAIDALREQALGDIDALFTDGLAGSIATGFNQRLEAENDDGYTAGFTGEQLDDFYNAADFRSGSVLSERDDFLAGAALGVVTVDAARGFLDDAFADATGLSGDRFGILLADVVDAEGLTLATFTEDASDSVGVSIDLPDLTADFGAVLERLVPGISVPFDLAFESSGATFDFRIESSVETSGGGLDSIGFGITGFDSIFELGGSAALAGTERLGLGLLDLDVTTLETARLGLFFGGSSDIGGVVDFTGDPSGDFVFGVPSGDTFAVEARIEALGTTGFVTVVPDTIYDLARIEAEGSLPLSGATSFDATLAVSTILDTLTGTNRPSAFVDNAMVDLDITGLDAALAETAATLAATGTGDILQFLDDVGDTLAGALRDAAFDLDIPLTDLNLRDATEALAMVFGTLAERFAINPAALGFGQAEFGDGVDDAAISVRELSFSPETDTRTAEIPTLGLLDALQGYTGLRLAVFDGSVDAEGNPAATLVDVDLEGSDAVDPAASVADRMAALAALLGNALGSTFTVTTTPANALRVTSSDTSGGGPGPATFDTFAIVAALRDDDSTDEDVTLADLGFGPAALSSLDGVAGYDRALHVLNFVPQSDAGELGPLQLDALAGLEAVRFALTVDGVAQPLDVVSTSGSGWADAAALVSDFNLALDAAGLGLTAALNGTDDGLAFSRDADEARTIELTTRGEDLLRAVDLQGLVAWVDSELQSALPGAGLELTDDGALIFRFPSVGATQTIGADDGLFFNTDDLGLGLAENLTLSARLSGEIDAMFTASAGIDLAGFGAQVAGGAGSPLDALSFGQNLSGALLDNVFLTDLSFSAQITGRAAEIQGTADLGLVAVSIGSDDPGANFMVADAQLEATLVGTDADGDFTDRLTFRNLFDALATQVTLGDDGNPVATAPPGLISLLGRYDLAGGIVLEGAGQGLEAANAGAVQIADAFGAEGLAQFLLKLGDIDITVAGIDGLNEGLIEGMGITVLDLRDIQNTFDIALLSDDPDALAAMEGLTALRTGDILDSLTAIANVLVVVGETLSDELPFLSEDVPLLNFSILDSFDFAADFLSALQEIRRDPQGALDVLDSYLEQVFGPGTVDLTWLGDAQTIAVDLTLEFLEDARQELPFQLDLAEMLGDALEGIVGEDLAATVTGLVAAGGQGSLVFQPLLSLNFSFGIDLSPTLATPSEIAGAALPLDQLASVSSVNFRPNGGPDLRIVRTDLDTGTPQETRVDLSAAVTLADAVAAIDTAVGDAFGSSVAFAYDEATGQVTLSDSDSRRTDDTGVMALFGASGVDSSDLGGVQTIELAAGFDFGERHNFTFIVNGAPVAIELNDPEAGGVAPTDAAEFAASVNALFSQIGIDRAVISDTAAPLLDIPLSQLVKMVEDGGDLSLRATNFAEANGYDPITFAVAPEDTSREIEFRIEQLGGSNLGRALGLEADGSAVVGDVTGEVLYENETIGAPRIYIDTDKTGIRAEFTAGIAEGLNVELGLGPLMVNVIDGKALVNAGDGSGDPAYLAFEIVDIDGDANAGQYDLRHIFAISSDPGASFAGLFGFDGRIGIEVDLPLSDTLGLFDPATDGLSWNSVLLSVASGDTLLDVSFEGDLIEIANGGGIDLSNFDLTLPDLSDFLSNVNVLALLNDPGFVLEGLDAILKQVQRVFDDFLSDITLPVIGDAIGTGVTFFDDFRYQILEPALAYATTPQEDGTLPTTIDLLENFVNGALNDLLGTDGEQYLQAFLDTSGPTQESYLYGVLNFSGEVFDEALDVDFDFGIPGFNLEVEKGSRINMKLDYTVNLGFGFDRNGFFLLNDTDRDEIGISFTVDAGTFEGSMSVLNVLGVNAKAVALDSEQMIDEEEPGVAQLTAELSADLYGDTGLLIDDGTPSDGRYVTATTAFRNFDEIAPRDGSGDRLDYEKVVYAAQLDTGKLIEFGFSADVDMIINVEGNILDPRTGKPITVSGGVPILPSVVTEIVIGAGYDTADGLRLDKLAFQNVRLDLNYLYEGILEPVLGPIRDFIDPLAAFFGFLEQEPVSFVTEVLGTVYPIIGMVNTIGGIVVFIDDLLEDLEETDGFLVFGTYDFSGNADAIASGEKRMSDVNPRDITRSQQLPDSPPSSGSNLPTSKADLVRQQFGVIGNPNQGLSIEIPLLRDPFSAVNILLGNFDQVDLIVANFTLFNVNTGVIDIADEVLNGLGAPGWVRDAIDSAFQATIELRLISQFSAGYDLSGIVNFVNTLDPERLLDGVFIDAAPGALLDVYIGASFRLNVGIAGLDAEGFAGVTLTFNDPNDDGKLRIPELIYVLDAAFASFDGGFGIDEIGEFLGLIFSGTAQYGFKLEIWAGIDFPSPIPDLKWSGTVFEGRGEVEFGNLPLPPIYGKDQDGSTVLNVGARAGGNMTDLTEDGDDTITVSGNGSFSVTLATDGKSRTGSVGGNALIIPAGEGANLVNLGAITSPTPTITYAGSGRDTIVLPGQGVHVVFAGAGDDTITAESGATGTYIVFGEEGTDSVDIDGGNVIYLGDDDFGVRDRFRAEFSSGTVTADRILNFFALGSDGTLQAGGQEAFFTGREDADEFVNLAGLSQLYTELTQVNAEKADETVLVGAGNHAIFTGAGDDSISAGDGALTGEVHVFSGDGSDTIVAGGADAFIEAGADRDLVISSAAASEVWGWGAAAGPSGLEGSAVIDALAQRDDSDVLLGGDGNDILFGQIGNEILQGGLGDDVLNGGIGDDIAVGGVIDMAFRDGSPIDITTFDLDGQLQQGITIAVENLADGDDSLSGLGGRDILIGGGGGDTLAGGGENDILLGDFGTVTLSANLVAESVETDFADSTNSGTDQLEGGQGNDILIAGAAAPGESETLQDYFGDNIFLGDFGRAEGAQVLTAATLVTSAASAAGGADLVQAGRGNDLVIGGEGADTIDAGLGGDLVLGDNGRFDITAGTVTGLGLGTDGDDVIEVGSDTPDQYDDDIPVPTDLKDIVIGGLGSDTVTAASGGLALIGDAGVIALDPVGLSALRNYAPPPANPTPEQQAANQRALDLIDTLAQSLQSTASAADGADSVTTTGGDAALILGGGGDTATLGEGLVYALADDGTLTVTPNEDYSGRRVVLTSAESLQAANDDTVTAAGGEALVIGGEGADSLTAGPGAHVILGDDGTIDRDTRSGEIVLSAASAHTAEDGDDTVTLGDGGHVAVLGGGADSLTAGDGGSLVLGDSGAVSLDPASTTATTSDAGMGDGDAIFTGAGDDVILAGDGADSVVGGEGANLVAGDGALYSRDRAAGLLDFETRDPGTGAGDTIETGAGGDRILGGDGADLVTAGAGTNAVLGDGGAMRLDPVTLALRSLATSAPEGGGNDTISALGGADILAGGAGDDRIDAGAGRDAILGDDGDYTAPSGGSEGLLRSAILSAGGADTVLAGSGNDLVIAGLGDDSVDVGAGDDVGLGDEGALTFVGATDPQTIVPTNQAFGGDDTLTAEGTSGDNILFGQAGDDSITGGETDDILAGDLVAITLSDRASALPGQSAVDRLVRLEGIAIGVEGSDVIAGGAGRDLIWGGFGADSLRGGAGQDMIIGDTAVLDRTLRFIPGAGMIEGIAVETNFPFVEGGEDTLRGDAGADIMIGNLGPDLFIGNTADDLLYSDAYAGTFEAEWGPQRFAGPTASLELLTSNFAGPGAIDIVSAAQQDDAIGSPLDFTTELEWILGEIEDADARTLLSQRFAPEDAAAPGLGDLGTFVDTVLDYLSSEAILGALSELVASGVDPDLVRAALLATLIDRFAAQWQGDGVSFERALQQMVDFILARVDLQSASVDMMGEPVAMAAE
ncbi:MAG: beta strand repeat-containing protein [Roseicyclus sp.]